MLRRLYRLWPHPGLLVRLGVLHAFMAVLQGLLLGVLVPILRALLQPEPDMAAAIPWLVVGGAGMLAYWLLSVVATPVGFAASMQLAAQLRHHVMAHVTTLPLGWFSADHKARLGRILTADVGNIAQLAVTIGAPAIVAALVPATVVLVTLWVDWRMAMLLLAIVPAAWWTLRRAGRIAAIADVELEEAATRIAGRAIELGQAQTVLRAAGLGRTGTPRMREALDEHRSTYRRGLRRSMLPDLTYTAVVMLGLVAAVALGSGLLVGGSVGLADTVALLILAVRFFEPLGALIELIGALRAMDNAIIRVQDVLDTPPLPHATTPTPGPDGFDIAFDAVGYAYDGTRAAVEGVSFRCTAGSTTALVGPSGSGKTTVIRLAARFFDPDAGSVRIGGVDVCEIDHAMLMHDIAIIFQDVYLFDTTIEENLRLARPDATQHELDAAARAACLDEMIRRLPQGWKTQVGEGGTRLSGGERQRVSIAMALLKRSRIVLIDEASSALDPENERAVGEAIAALSRDRGRTLIVIAHRPATLAAVDHVVVLEQGRVVECGEPATLRLRDGLFARLFRQYEDARTWQINRPAGQEKAREPVPRVDRAH